MPLPNAPSECKLSEKNVLLDEIVLRAFEALTDTALFDATSHPNRTLTTGK